MSFRPEPGAEFHLSGVWHQVETYNRAKGLIVAVDRTGTLTTLALEDLVHHPSLTVPGERTAHVDVSGEVDEHQKKIVALRIAEVREALTGYRSGRPDEARPEEPRPEYDPSITTKKARLAAKEKELDKAVNRELGVFMSVSTMRRIETALKNGEAIKHALGKRKPRRSKGHRTMLPVFESAAAQAIRDRESGSTVTERTLYIEMQRIVLQSRDVSWLRDHLPSFSTWRRWAHERYTKSQLTGKASTRESRTKVPEDGFNPERLVRPGQLVVLDTNNLDVLLKGTALEGVIKGSLVTAIDAYSWSCCALRIVEQVETSVDVAMTFLDIGRPVQMHPDWDSDYRWPFVGMPEHMIATIGGVTRVAGMPVVNPEAISVDHGSTYKSEKIRNLVERHKGDILPARKRTGSDKAPVERFFRAMQTMLLQKLGGYRGSNTAERGRNTESTVEYTAQSLEDLLVRWVILAWQTHIMDDHKPAWCPEGDWSPNDLYQHGITTGGFMPTLYTAEDYYATLRTVQVKVHDRGVNVNGLWYDDPILNDWRSKPAPNGSKKWSVQADERDLRTVQWIDAEGERHILRWTGITGDFPAFSKRHVRALRNRVGDLRRHDSKDLAVILLTKVLPVPGEDGSWKVEERRANAAASRHQREVDLAERDRARAGLGNGDRDSETDAVATTVAGTPPAAPAGGADADEPVFADDDSEPTAQPSDDATAKDGGAAPAPDRRAVLREQHERAVEENRRARRRLATQDEDTAAPELGSGRPGLLGGSYPIEDDGAA